jgi:hypothetical protein
MSTGIIAVALMVGLTASTPIAIMGTGSGGIIDRTNGRSIAIETGGKLSVLNCEHLLHRRESFRQAFWLLKWRLSYAAE